MKKKKPTEIINKIVSDYPSVDSFRIQRRRVTRHSFSSHHRPFAIKSSLLFNLVREDRQEVSPIARNAIQCLNHRNENNLAEDRYYSTVILLQLRFFAYP